MLETLEEYIFTFAYQFIYFRVGAEIYVGFYFVHGIILKERW